MNLIKILSLDQFKTQKARGCAALSRSEIVDTADTQALSTDLLNDTLVWPHDSLEKIREIIHLRPFVRPCPSKARHGFIASRRISSIAGFKDLVDIAINEDPDAEMMVSPYYQAEFSAVVTPNTLTIGDGNSGATSGGPGNIFIPFPSGRSVDPVFINSTSYRHDLYGIAEGETVYYELIGKTGRPVEIVQARSGPVPPTKADFIPHDVVVTEYAYVHPTYDALKWEKLMKEKSGNPGFVAYSDYCAITSHYGVHARLNNIPFISSRNFLNKGEVFKKNTDSDLSITPEALLELADCIRADRAEVPWYMMEGISVPTMSKTYSKHLWWRCHAMAALTLTAAHNWLDWDLTVPGISKLVAACLNGYVRLAVCAMGGELRHWKNEGPHGVKRLTKTPPMRRRHWGNLNRSEREATYVRYITRQWSDITRIVDTAITDFKAQYWNGAFGGTKWAHCGMTVKALIHSTNVFIESPTAENWATVNAALHNSINAQHNGDGRMLNKFVDYDVFNHAELYPVANIVRSPYTIELIHRITR